MRRAFLPVLLSSMIGLLVLSACSANTPASDASPTATTPAAASDESTRPTIGADPSASPPTESMTTPGPVIDGAFGYSNDEVFAVCGPAISAAYPGVAVAPDPTGLWFPEDGSAVFEYLAHAGTVSWTTNSDFDFPPLCVINDTDPSIPTVVYVGVADI